MLFHTLDYLVFLPLCVALYWVLPRRLRLGVLLVSSLVFYASWSVGYLLVLVGVAFVAWLGARSLVDTGLDTKLRRAGVLAVLLGPLIFFKYWDWLADNFEVVAGWLGAGLALPRVDLPLPVGISFFTFQALAYVIDCARDGRTEDEPLTLATFLAFFPQLVAGPIVRRHELLPQLHSLSPLRQGQVGSGIFRICQGMAKKVLIADVVRVGMVDPVFADPGRFTGPELLVALYAYTLQIYFDFSAYTDIAIGSAKLFGFELPENFRRPYKATCVAGFWRRWHITLSNWVRDYVYYPLGGSKVSADWKVYRNILATMVIIGIWHGASWNFVIYGTLHGSAVCFCRWRRKTTGRRPDDPHKTPLHWLLGWAVTFHFVVLARILFRAEDLGGAWEILSGLQRLEFLMPRYSPTVWMTFLLGFALHFSPSDLAARLEARFRALPPAVWAGAAAATGLAMALFGSGDSLAFVYYQF